MKKHIVWVGLVLVSILIAFGVAKKIGRSDLFNDSSKPQVVTTIFPLYDITKTIAGDRVGVSVIVDQSSSPHAFTISPDSLKEASQADLLFYLGHGLDDYIVNEYVQALQIRTKVVDEGSTILSDEEGEDPHYWLGLENAKAIATSVASSLSELDPEGQLEFESNLALFIKNVEQLKDFYQSKFLEQEAKIATFHNAFGYLAQDLGFTVVATFEEFPGEEPTAQWLNEFSKTVKEGNLQILYAEPQFSTSAIESLAKDLGLQLGVLDPLGGKSDSYSYITLIKMNVDTILQDAQAMANDSTEI